MIIVLNEALEVLKKSDNATLIRYRGELLKQLEMGNSFLNFVSLFIEDLLAVNMYNNGVLNLANKAFSPIKAINFVIDLCKPYF